MRALNRLRRSADFPAMEWQTIRSARDPRFWLPLASALLLAPLLGLAAQLWTRAYLHELYALRASNPPAAVAAAEQGLRALGQIVCGFSLLSSALLFRYFQLGSRQHRLPPSGWWSLGARRIAVGPGARRLCRLGVGLSFLLAAAGVGLLIAVHQLLAAFGAHA
jgi:hypothetical protein